MGFAGYDALVAFDPDHLPQPGYLDRTLGYLADPSVGYVQAAQAYYNQHASLVAHGAAEETYAYFSAVQMASYGMEYPIIVGGHNLHRMAALREVGGFAVHDADDLLLTLRYRAAGWQGVYHPEILARGLTPVDWQGYLVQQRRWARSVLDLKFRHRGEYAGSLPIATRAMSFLHGLNFLHRSLAHAGLVASVAYLLLTGGQFSLLTPELLAPSLLLLGAIAAQEAYRQQFYLDPRGERGLHWRGGLVGFAKWPWFLLALADVLTRRDFGYVVTKKTPGTGSYRSFVAWNLALAAVVLVCWIVGRERGSVGLPLSITAGSITLLSIVLAVHGMRTPPPPWSPTLAPPSATRVEPAYPVEASR